MIDEATPAPKREIRALFDALGVDYAEVTFSGGNDEGGAERIECVMRGTGERVYAAVHHIASERWDPARCRMVPNPEWATVSPARKLANLLDDVPGWKYGSFAGDFYVSGLIRVERSGNSVSARFFNDHYEDDDYGDSDSGDEE